MLPHIVCKSRRGKAGHPEADAIVSQGGQGECFAESRKIQQKPEGLPATRTRCVSLLRIRGGRKAKAKAKAKPEQNQSKTKDKSKGAHRETRAKFARNGGRREGNYGHVHI